MGVESAPLSVVQPTEEIDRIARIIEPKAFATWDAEYDAQRAAGREGPTFMQLQVWGTKNIARQKAVAILAAVRGEPPQNPTSSGTASPE